MVSFLFFLAGLVVGYLFHRNNPKKSALVDSAAKKAVDQAKERLGK